MTVDWEYQKCDVCGALPGKPCVETSGFVVGSGPLEVQVAEPHSTRKLRVAAARAGGSDG